MAIFLVDPKTGKMSPVQSREELLKLRNSQSHKDRVQTLRRDKNVGENAKKKLLQFNYSCLPNEDGTIYGTKRLSNSFAVDIDDIYPDKMEEVKEQILENPELLGLLLLERSINGNGYHIVLKRKPEFNQHENLMYVRMILRLYFDETDKDPAKVFYATTGDPDDLIYLNDEIFSFSEFTPKGINKTIDEAIERAKEKAFSTEKFSQVISTNSTNPQIHKSTNEELPEDTEDEDETQQSDGNCPPPMPKQLPKLIELLISNTPDIYKPAVAHAVFPALAAHLYDTRFRYIDNEEHEATLMNVLMAGTGAGKSCINKPIEYIMEDIRLRDELNREAEAEWKAQNRSKGSNKDKDKRPDDLIIQYVMPDMTNAAFIQRTKDANEHFLYSKINEIEHIERLSSGVDKKAHFTIMCYAFDQDNRYGTERVGTESVSETVKVRYNWNAATTIHKGKAFFKPVLTGGPISRINFCTIPEQPIGAAMPRYGKYDNTFREKLRPYIDRLNQASGLIECDEALDLAIQLDYENKEYAIEKQDRVYDNLSHRANVIAYLKAMVLYVASGEWEECMSDFIRWSEQYDMWCKMQFFGEEIAGMMEQNDSYSVSKAGRKSMLSSLPVIFTVEDLLRVHPSGDNRKATRLLSAWKSKGYIELADQKSGTFRKLA